MPQLLAVFIVCFLVSSCGGAIPFVGEGSDSVLTASDQSYSLRLAPQWSVAGKGVKSGDMGRDAVYVLAHPDGARSDQGYPTMVVREVRDKAPVGLFELMAKDKGLEYSELWSVGKDKYQLRQAQVDDKGKLLTYWLVPAGGQGVEYFGAMYLTSWGRLELIGLAQAGTAQKYAKDFGAMIASVRLEGKTDPEGGKSGDLGRYLIRTYRQSIERERQALARLSSDIAAQAAGGAGMDGLQKGMLQTSFARAAAGCLEAAAALESQLSQAEGGASAERLSAWQAQVERLDAAVTAIETIELNLRDQTAKTMVEKAAVRARKLAALGREVRALPL